MRNTVLTLNITKYLSSTMARTIVYTIGHMLIAIACIIFITGSDPLLATVDAIIEPLINAVWYYILDTFWSRCFATES